MAGQCSEVMIVWVRITTDGNDMVMGVGEASGRIVVERIETASELTGHVLAVRTNRAVNRELTREPETMAITDARI